MIVVNENKNINNGIGFVGTLQIAFIILKLCKIINWSWFVVMLPAIISISLVLVVLLFCLVLIIREYKRF